MKQLTYRQINGWLLSIDALVVQTTYSGRSQKRPTEKGRQIGITLDTRNGMNGEYQVVVYNKEAQIFILDNIDAIIAFGNE